MPTIQSNPITHGLRGMLGGTVVFRVLNGKTVVSNRPKKAKTLTEHQENTKARFLDAVHYAKCQMADAASREEYGKGVNEKLSNAYTVALADYLKGPEITDVNTDGFHGRQGDPIVVYAIDNFKVESVWVELRSAGGELLEAGNAVQQMSTTVWVFAATKPLAASGNVQVVVTAKDKPGNTTLKSITVNAPARVPEAPFSPIAPAIIRSRSPQQATHPVYSTRCVSRPKERKECTLTEGGSVVAQSHMDARAPRERLPEAQAPFTGSRRTVARKRVPIPSGMKRVTCKPPTCVHACGHPVGGDYLKPGDRLPARQGVALVICRLPLMRHLPGNAIGVSYRNKEFG
jgi:hypothetical protein